MSRTALVPSPEPKATGSNPVSRAPHAGRSSASCPAWTVPLRSWPRESERAHVPDVPAGHGEDIQRARRRQRVAAPVDNLSAVVVIEEAGEDEAVGGGLRASCQPRLPFKQVSGELGLRLRRRHKHREQHELTPSLAGRPAGLPEGTIVRPRRTRVLPCSVTSAKALPAQIDRNLSASSRTRRNARKKCAYR